MSDTIPAKQEIRRTRHRGYDLIWRHDGTVAVSRPVFVGRRADGTRKYGDQVICVEDGLFGAVAIVDWMIDQLALEDSGQWPLSIAAKICPVFRHITGRAA